MSGQQTAQQQEAAVSEDEIYGVMDVLDEDLIRMELGGTLLNELVYEFDVKSKEKKIHVQGLTVAGANQMARITVQENPRISILCEKPITEERPNSFKSFCKVAVVGPTGNRFEVWGEKVQPKSIIRNDGTVAKENDPNAEVICDMKAQRNGLLKVFPPKSSAEFFKKILTEGQKDDRTDERRIKRLTDEEMQKAVRKWRQVGRSLAQPIPTETKPFDTVATQSAQPAAPQGNGERPKIPPETAASYPEKGVKTPNKTITEEDQQRLHEILEINKIRFRVYGPNNKKEWIADDPDKNQFEEYAALRATKLSGAAMEGFDELASFLTAFGGTFIEPPNISIGRPGFIYALVDKNGEIVIQRKKQ